MTHEERKKVSETLSLVQEVNWFLKKAVYVLDDLQDYCAEEEQEKGLVLASLVQDNMSAINDRMRTICRCVEEMHENNRLVS